MIEVNWYGEEQRETLEPGPSVRGKSKQERVGVTELLLPGSKLIESSRL